MRWHGGRSTLVGRVVRRTAPLPGMGYVARACARVMIGGGRLLDRVASALPMPIAAAGLLALDKAGALAGHLLYEAGVEEPRLSELLGRPEVRG